MAKRRSRTRVGRDRPRPTASVPTALLIPIAAHRLTAPVIHGGHLYRVIESAAGQCVLQEWCAGYWMPSLLPLYELNDARLATERDLAERQVPIADRLATEASLAWTAPTLTRLPHQEHVARSRKSHVN